MKSITHTAEGAFFSALSGALSFRSCGE